MGPYTGNFGADGAGARIALIGTLLAEHSRVRLRCLPADEVLVTHYGELIARAVQVDCDGNAVLRPRGAKTIRGDGDRVGRHLRRGLADGEKRDEGDAAAGSVQTEGPTGDELPIRMRHPSLQSRGSCPFHQRGLGLVLG